jgi:hypothetical protein
MLRFAPPASSIILDRSCSSPAAVLSRITGVRLHIRSAVALRSLAGALLALALFFPAAALVQGQGQAKIPKIGKIAGGKEQQAFTGKVQSVDTKLKLLNMMPVEGKGSEIFPVKKNVEVRNIKGERIPLKQLKAGSEVVIYYEMKGSRRTVKRIIELSAGSQTAKEKPSPPS